MNPKELIKLKEKEFNDLHLACMKETRELGKAKYSTHGKRCEVLGELKALKQMNQIWLDRIDKEIVRMERLVKEMDLPNTSEVKTKLRHYKELRDLEGTK